MLGNLSFRFREEPRLTNLLRTQQASVLQDDSRIALYPKLAEMIEQKRDQVRCDQIESNSLSWSFIRAQLNSKNKKAHLSTVEQQNGTNYVANLLKQVEQLISGANSTQMDMQLHHQVVPAISKQFYKIVWQERFNDRRVKGEKVVEDLKSMFGSFCTSITISQVEHVINVSRKLLDWVERNRVKEEGDVKGSSSCWGEDMSLASDDDQYMQTNQLKGEYGADLKLDVLQYLLPSEMKEKLKELLSINTTFTSSQKLSNVKPLISEQKEQQTLIPVAVTASTPLSIPPTKQDEEDKDEDEEEEEEESTANKTAPQSTPKSAPRQLRITYSWLKAECQKVLKMDVTPSIVQVIQQGGDDLLLQSRLFDIVGENGFDLLAKILEYKDDIADPNFLRNTNSMDVHKHPAPSKMQQILSTVSIRSKEDIELQKQKKKEAKKALRQQLAAQKNKTGEQREQEEEDRQMQWLQSSLEHKLQEWKEKKKELAAKKGNTILELIRAELPEVIAERMSDTMDIQRTVGDGWEQYEIAAPVPKEDGGDFVKITEFEDWAQLAFKGFTQLNRVQSKVYPAAYKTNENLLVCAPTGCGKTNIALMAMLREIGLHFRGGILRTEEFKIIYVAPMKALAQEMVENFSKRLAPLGLSVREMTGDMQLSKKDITKTQVIVTTPEKWDVITRKGSDMALLEAVKLLILDEVHLLAEDRGPVIECLVSRTLRQVESTQSMIRIVGLSATLPNYEDVATFLRVNPEKGLFFFDNSYRPVPLKQKYIGVADSNQIRKLKLYNDICYEKVLESLNEGNQVMIFVHSRNETMKTCNLLRDLALSNDDAHLFIPSLAIPQWATQSMRKTPNKELRDLFPYGFGFHNAGMLRSDRNLVEKMFREGYIRVLCCTSTLAWGVNLPAHTVVIKGTEIYDAKKGQITELSMLDVMQIFGRAGRPQYDTSGEGIIITSISQLPRYLKLLNHAIPIESKLTSQLEDHLNAEIVLGTITNLREAIQWLSYTYMFIRILKNPMVYGISYEQLASDPMLSGFRRDIIETAAKKLHSCKMVRYNQEGQTFGSTDLGRIASHFYIHHETIQLFNETMKPTMSEEEVLNLISSAREFNNLKLRDEEIPELVELMENCKVKVKNGVSSTQGKVNVLVQTYISKTSIRNFALVSDCAYVVQSINRIVRALFEICMKRGWPSIVDKLLLLSKCIDKRMWAFENPLRQFPTMKPEIIHAMEDKKVSLDALNDMDSDEIGEFLRFKGYGKAVQNCLQQFPAIELELQAQPITRTILRVQVQILAAFEWNKKVHSDAEPFWVWVEDDKNEHIYHSEYFLLKEELKNEPQSLQFIIPIIEPRPTVVFVKVVSDRWIGVQSQAQIFMKDIILPEHNQPHTDLLVLQPLPISVLNNPEFEKLYTMTHFNPLQTQIFHTLYHSDNNVLVGAPTGSGKTIVSELAILRLFNEKPKAKVVYIAPLKALVRERVDEWRKKFEQKINRRIVELTGDHTPDIKLLSQADIIITTPEKWDGISRNWQQRSYVRDIGLMIMDEVHLLGSDRGHILEVIVSRMRYISWTTNSPVRMVGLSTTLSNSRDMADWLGIEKRGLYNFRPSVRPVPITVHIQGFTGKHYCPRMQSMNKPTYQAILNYSRNKPVLVFVSSRRQTRLTAIDLISYCATDENPRRFLKMSEPELDAVLKRVHDNNLRHTLVFGIGIHHAGLTSGDKTLVENLFVTEKIQVLVATSTLAWGVNFPCHLVIVKGTEFFDPKTKRYVDYPLTDVLQMMGRAGRPQYDNQGIACIFAQESKKNFYKKFLYESFPVESSLQSHLHDHLNAEIVSGTIGSRQDAVDYLTWTFFFRRLVQNPTYYKLDNSSYENLNKYLSKLVGSVIEDLEKANCCKTVLNVMKKEHIEPTSLGTIASYYYLSYQTTAPFASAVTEDASIRTLLQLLCNAKEYAELPVRHNEDKLNSELAKIVPWPLECGMTPMDSPHVKTQLLLQAHFGQLLLPISDYVTDTKSVLDQTIRIIQAFVDIVAEKGYLNTALNLMMLMQMVMQGRFMSDNPMLMFASYLNDRAMKKLQQVARVELLPQFIEMDDRRLKQLLREELSEKQIDSLLKIKERLPLIQMTVVPTKDEKNPKLMNITVQLIRQTKFPKMAYLPNFPKPKDEGQWIVIGNCDKGAQMQTGVHAGELLALKRIRMSSKKTTVELSVPVPENNETRYTVFLMSDCYIGLDQQIDISLGGIALKPKAAQQLVPPVTQVSQSLQQEEEKLLENDSEDEDYQNIQDQDEQVDSLWE